MVSDCHAQHGAIAVDAAVDRLSVGRVLAFLRFVSLSFHLRQSRRRDRHHLLFPVSGVRGMTALCTTFPV